MRAMSDPTTVIAATDPATLRTIADEAFAAFNSGGRHVQSFSARYPGFTLDDAYRVTALANELRVANGYKPVGRKIGFTNRQMWDEYGVGAPNWGYVYDRTLHDLAVPLPLAPYTEPKIEPEIMFGLAAAPSSGMDDAALLSCIAWVAHGFEIVQSIFPGWKFSLPDCTAANAMHGALLVGPRHEIGTRADEWLRTLAAIRSRALLRRKTDGAGLRLECPRGPAIGRSLSRGAARARPGQSAARRRRNHIDRHADARIPGEGRRDVDDEAQGHQSGRRQPAI